MAICAESKKTLRMQILSHRRALTNAEVAEFSEKICNKILDLEAYRKAEHVCIYMPINKEVDVAILAEPAWQHGKKVWLPVTKNGEMWFVRYEKDTVLNIGNYGIMEPDSKEILIPDKKTFMIMPGAVFSEEGDRIGYGGGYYDQYLAKYPMIRTCAAAYQFQIVEKLPAEEHDVRPELIITEKKVICSDSKK